MAAPKIVVIYHGDCLDGFGAAWAAWKKFGNRAEYLATSHYDRLPRGKGRRAYFLDIVTEDRADFERFRKNNRVTVIDHHVSTRPITVTTEDYRYDIKHSGAVLAFQYFHPGKPVPRALKYIEDMDLWNLALPKTREIRTVLQLMPFDLRTWDAFIRKFEGAAFRKKMMEDGTVLRRFEEQQVRRIARNYKEKVRFMGHTVYAVNSTIWSDELSHELYEEHPPFAIVWRMSGGNLRVSLRGTGKPDLSKIAQKFGGGGHAVSAGFIIPARKGFPWKPIGSK